MRSRFTLALLVTAALAIAGCGSSSSEKNTPSTTAPVTRQAFVAQLDSLCKRANAAFQAAPNKTAQATIVAKYVAIFRSVDTPPQLKALYARYIAVLEKELADLKRGDTNGLSQLATTQARPLAKQLGATGCVT